MATPNRFLKWFSNNTKSESRRRVGTHMKNVGLQNGDSAREYEGQARIQIGENVAFD